jgi:hypothetical protein
MIDMALSHNVILVRVPSRVGRSKFSAPVPDFHGSPLSTLTCELQHENKKSTSCVSEGWQPHPVENEQRQSSGGLETVKLWVQSTTEYSSPKTYSLTEEGRIHRSNHVGPRRPWMGHTHLNLPCRCIFPHQGPGPRKAKASNAKLTDYLGTGRGGEKRHSSSTTRNGNWHISESQ